MIDPKDAEDLLAAVRLLRQAHPCLGDFVYDIRDQELQGWDGPRVRAWSDGYCAMEVVMRRIDAKEFIKARDETKETE